MTLEVQNIFLFREMLSTPCNSMDLHRKHALSPSISLPISLVTIPQLVEHPGPHTSQILLPNPKVQENSCGSLLDGNRVVTGLNIYPHCELRHEMAV